jgi:hypothetical protein
MTGLAGDARIGVGFGRRAVDVTSRRKSGP